MTINFASDFATTTRFIDYGWAASALLLSAESMWQLNCYYTGKDSAAQNLATTKADGWDETRICAIATTRRALDVYVRSAARIRLNIRQQPARQQWHFIRVFRVLSLCVPNRSSTPFAYFLMEIKGGDNSGFTVGEYFFIFACDFKSIQTEVATGLRIN